MSDEIELTDAKKAESRRLTARARKRLAQSEQDILAGMWRFSVLHKADFDKDGSGTWLYHDAHPSHAETTTVVLLKGLTVLVFKCVADREIDALRWISCEVCEPDGGTL